MGEMLRFDRGELEQHADEFCDREGLTVIPLPDLHGTAILLKQE